MAIIRDIQVGASALISDYFPYPLPITTIVWSNSPQGVLLVHFGVWRCQLVFSDQKSCSVTE